MAFRRRDAELIGIAKQGGGFLIQRVNQVGDFGREAVDQAFRLAGPARAAVSPSSRAAMARRRLAASNSAAARPVCASARAALSDR